MPDHRPALSDIAAALGVSTMTVSRALGGRPGVSPALRARIQQQAIALGYRPDPSIHRLMRHLRTRRQRGISAVIAAITDIPQHLEPTYCARLREHAALRAHALGFAFSLVRVSPGPGGWPSALRALRSQGVDGLMLLPMIDPIALDAVDWSAFSVVSATSSVTTPLFHRVGPHHPLNARLLVDRLSARGFHRIGFVGTHTHSLRSFDSFPSALAWHHARLGLRCMPLLHPAGTAPDIVAWARRERPDVIIAGRHTDLPAYQKQLARARLAPSWALAVVDSNIIDLPGLDERHDLIAAAAIDVLAGLITRSERGVPAVPTMTLLAGEWRDAPLKMLQ